MQVDVYRNLNSNSGRYSVKNMEYGTDGYGCVVDDSPCDIVMVQDVEFVVHESGRQKVRDENRKNAHAFVRGEWITPQDAQISDQSTKEVIYNPYEYETFVKADTEEPIEKAAVVRLDRDGVRAEL